VWFRGKQRSKKSPCSFKEKSGEKAGEQARAPVKGTEPLPILQSPALLVQRKLQVGPAEKVFRDSHVANCMVLHLAWYYVLWCGGLAKFLLRDGVFAGKVVKCWGVKSCGDAVWRVLRAIRLKKVPLLPRIDHRSTKQGRPYEVKMLY
jgi:hypothetical protein